MQTRLSSYIQPHTLSPFKQPRVLRPIRPEQQQAADDHDGRHGQSLRVQEKVEEQITVMTGTI